MIPYSNYKGDILPKPEGIDFKWRITGCAIIIQDDSLLMILDTLHEDTKLFELPGGGVEPHESIHEGIIREVKEETGYTINITEAVPFFITENYFQHPRDKTFYHSINVFYKAGLTSDAQDKKFINTVIENEIAEVKWIQLNDLSDSNIIFPGHRETIQKLLTSGY